MTARAAARRRIARAHVSCVDSSSSMALRRPQASASAVIVPPRSQRPRASPWRGPSRRTLQARCPNRRGVQDMRSGRKVAHTRDVACFAGPGAALPYSRAAWNPSTPWSSAPA
jgi:hypothetical protein